VQPNTRKNAISLTIQLCLQAVYNSMMEHIFLLSAVSTKSIMQANQTYFKRCFCTYAYEQQQQHYKDCDSKMHILYVKFCVFHFYTVSEKKNRTPDEH